MGSMQAGTHTVSYQAIAATRGVFTLPPAYALVEDQPELMGLSQGGTVIVGDGKANLLSKGVAVPDAKAAPVVVAAFLMAVGAKRNVMVSPIGCPAGCPDASFCQLSTGKCLCKSISGGDEECVVKNVTKNTVSTTVPPAAAPQDPVVTTMRVENVNYAVLQQDTKLLTQFTQAIKKALADKAGPHVKEEHVAIKLSAGSVVVEATITAPQGVSSANLQKSLADSKASLAEHVVTVINALPMGAAKTGDIKVSGLQVTRVYTVVSTTRRAAQPIVSGSTSMSIRALPVILSGVLVAFTFL